MTDKRTYDLPGASPSTPKSLDQKDISVAVNTDDCWLYASHLMKTGYGLTTYSLNGRTKTLLVHRVFYEYHKGAIPDGLEIDHLCRVPQCINPDHMEAVTHQENIKRRPNTRKKRTHCVKGGHELTEDNVYTWAAKDGSRAYRQCIKCSKRRSAAHHVRNKLAKELAV